MNIAANLCRDILVSEVYTLLKLISAYYFLQVNLMHKFQRIDKLRREVLSSDIS